MHGGIRYGQVCGNTMLQKLQIFLIECPLHVHVQEESSRPAAPHLLLVVFLNKLLGQNDLNGNAILTKFVMHLFIQHLNVIFIRVHF